MAFLRRNSLAAHAKGSSWPSRRACTTFLHVRRDDHSVNQIKGRRSEIWAGLPLVAQPVRASLPSWGPPAKPVQAVFEAAARLLRLARLI